MPVPSVNAEKDDDAALLDRARAGDEHAFRHLVERYESDVAATVVGMLGPGPEADDVGQETFIRFFRALDQFRGDASLKTYLTRIAINLSLNAAKRRKRNRQRYVSRDQPGRSLPEPSMPGGSALDDTERKALVQQTVRTLDPKHRAVVTLRLIRGFSTKETAQMLNVPDGTVLSRLARAKDKLRPKLAPYFDDE